VFEAINFNFFSIGWLIAVIFYSLTSVYFLNIPKRSKASFHLGINFIAVTILSLAYFLSASIYHPASSIHRYFTIIFSIGSAIHFNQFIFCFPREIYPRVRKGLLIGMWIIAIATGLIFFIYSLNAGYIYHFHSHYWDFSLDSISKKIGIIIALYAILNIGFGFWRTLESKGKERKAMLSITLAYTSLSIIPGMANFLSRDGLILREIYLLLIVFLGVIGFFLIINIYINNTIDRTTVMEKIVMISLVLTLTILLGINYFFFQNNEKYFDRIHYQLSKNLIFDKTAIPEDLEYIAEYSFNNDSLSVNYTNKKFRIDFKYLKNETMNSVIMDRIKFIKDKDSIVDFVNKMDVKCTFFAGYSNAIKKYIKTVKRDRKINGRTIIDFLSEIERTVFYRKNKIKALPDKNFKNELQNWLKNDYGDFNPFRNAIASCLEKNQNEGRILKNEILQYLNPMQPPGTRRYRQDINGTNHFITYSLFDKNLQTLYETGYSYISYRKFLHPYSVKIVVILVVVVFLILLGFRFFFLNTMLVNLKNLVNGMEQVQEGNLDVSVPINIEDEIGSATRIFNKMVSTIKSANKKIKKYTGNLEKMVQDRTSELKKAMNELEISNLDLTRTKDALWGEMELAKKIQTVLLPVKPEIKGYEISVYMEPAAKVGGDYYDIIHVADIDWIIIGDVSGHGVPAGLIMMMVQTAINVTLVKNPDMPPSELLKTVNTTITRNIQHLGEDKYMTITVLATFKDGQFIFSGLHQDILVYRSDLNKVELVETDGVWIGIMDEIDEIINNRILTLKIGDSLLLHTDGITEAWKKGTVENKRSAAQDMFGKNRLVTLFEELGSLPTEDIKKGILKELNSFMCHDDITLIIIRRKE